MENKDQINVFNVVNCLLNDIDTQTYQVSNMKINQLLYYIQGHYIAKHEEPLFNELIEAWLCGPIIPHIYGKFLEFVDRPIPNNYVCFEATNNALNPSAKNIIYQVIAKYANISQYDLSVMIHNASPWKNAYNPRKQWKNNLITTQLLTVFFKNKII
ncbi:Panacea domain-containing protein [Candidatus Phytoplasma pyri]|uniref:Panacea domain-containing protein n=1 Tax=Candidatus Phytoplasma pyri TaxID=47566 RepID=UPI00398378FF